MTRPTTHPMSWTERYLAAVLRSIPEPKRADVERELRSSIEDGIEERVAAGEDATAAERAVLEGLGDPAVLASAYTGTPNYLVGPELFPVWRHVIPRLVLVAAPIATIAMAALRIIAGADYADAIASGISLGITVVIQIAFWGTLFFVFLERADAARDAREEIASKVGAWTVERLPEPARNRVTVGETIGEMIGLLLVAAGLLFVRSFEVRSPGGEGAPIPLLAPELFDLWVPFLAGVLVALALVHAVVYAVGRWTPRLATAFAIVEIAWAAPIVFVALQGTLINPAFAAHVGWPALAEGDAPVMLAIAVFTTLVTGWEIFDAFRKARNAPSVADLARSLGRTV